MKYFFNLSQHGSDLTQTTMQTMTTPTNYWTATALNVAKPIYIQDDCGVKHRVNPENEMILIPCEPYCTACGYPPNICDEYFTKCTGTTLGSWFDEEKGKWIEESEPVKTPQQEEEERWNQHKFGLCPMCKIGIDDKSEFTFNYTTGTPSYGTLMCWDCHAKLTTHQKSF